MIVCVELGKSIGAGGGRIRRQEYAFGKAVVFGAGFRHSTEPGSSTEPGREPHVFLCFTFGTDRNEAWPLIAQTIDGDQSRMLCRPDGEIVLTQLGRSMQMEMEPRLTLWSPTGRCSPWLAADLAPRR